MSQFCQEAPKASPTGREAAESGRSLSEIALQLAKRSLASDSLDELYFTLTNDLRCLIEFDRAFVVSLNSSKPKVVASNSLPLVNNKSKVIDQINDLFHSLGANEKALLISKRFLRQDYLGDAVSPEAKGLLRKYMLTNRMSALFILPLGHKEIMQWRLFLEFSQEPQELHSKVKELISVGSILSAALYQKTLELNMNKAAKLSLGSLVRGAPTNSWVKRSCLLAMMIVLACVLFVIPFPVNVGGEAEIVCRDSRMAYSNLNGSLAEIMVHEGDFVKKGRLIARLDPTEADLELGALKSRYDILTEQMKRLGVESGQDPTKLAQRKLMALQREGVNNEIRYLQWKRKNLHVRAPVDGIIITKGIKALEGKRVQAGEVICEIARPQLTQAVIFLPEEKLSNIKPLAPAWIYLNSAPLKAIPLVIKEVAPYTEYHPRVGSACRVYGEFKSRPKGLKFGMKGIGKIKLSSSSLFSILRSRLSPALNRLSLHF